MATPTNAKLDKRQSGFFGFGKSKKDKEKKEPEKADAAPAAELDPQKANLAQKFEAFMEEKCFKPEVREKMRQLPDQTKWMMLMQAADTKTEKKETDDPQYWFKALSSPKLTEHDLVGLEVVLRGQGKSWMQNFVDAGGLGALLSIVSNEAKHMPNSLLALKTFMNNGFGLKTILDTPAAIEQIASVLSFGNEAMMSTAFDLLGVLCWISPKAHHSVLEALANPRFKSPKYKFLVDILNRATNPDVKNACLSLINVLINTTDALEERMFLRQQLTDLGLRDSIEKTQQQMFADREPRWAEVFARMAAQCDLFEEEARNDKRETTHNALDIGDVDAVYAYVKDVSGVDGFGDQFLKLLQTVMTLPSSREQCEKTWRNIETAVALACNQMSDETGEIQALTIGSIKEALTKRAEEEGVTGQAGSSILEAQRKQIQDLKIRAMGLEEKLKSTANELQKAKTAGISSIGPGSAPPVADGEAAAEIQRLRDEVANLRNQLQAGGGAPAAPDAPPLDGAPPAPPLDGVPMAPSLDGAPMAPPIDAPDAPPLDGVPMAPPMDGVPGAPPIDGIPMAPDAAPPIDDGPKLPPKPVIKPKLPMKNIHWTVVDPKQVGETCWSSLSDDHIKLDVKDLENQFTTKKKEEKAPAAAGGAKTTSPGKKKEPAVELIDAKRSYNVNISLARFRMTNEEIRDALLSMDENVMTEERLSALLKCAPTPEEIETVKQYDGDVSVLGNTEKFFRVIAVVPKVEKRVNLFLFKLRFSTVVGEIENMLGLCERATKMLRGSKSLHRVLEIVLALGNYLNGGTKKGQAYGFRLDTLFKLSGTKAQDGTNLLHHLTKIVRDHYKDAREFLDDLSMVGEASRVESTFLQAEVGKLLGQIRQIAGELKSSESAGASDNFIPVMKTFYEQVASKKGEEVEKRLQAVQKEGEELIRFYGENPERKKLEEMYSLFRDFVEEYKTAEDFLEKKRQKEEREAKRDAEKAQREKKAQQVDQQRRASQIGEQPVEAPVAPVLVELKQPEGGQVDAVMKTLQATDASDIMKQIRMRRKQAQATKTIAKPGMRPALPPPPGPSSAAREAESPPAAAAAAAPAPAPLPSTPPRSVPSDAQKLPAGPVVGQFMLKRATSGPSSPSPGPPPAAAAPAAAPVPAQSTTPRGPGGPPRHPPPPELVAAAQAASSSSASASGPYGPPGQPPPPMAPRPAGRPAPPKPRP